MSEAVVKCPFVRLPLASITMAVTIVLAGFNLVRLHTLCANKSYSTSQKASHLMVYIHTVYVYISGGLSGPSRLPLLAQTYSET